MKKYLIIFCALLACGFFEASAQNRIVDLKTTLITPPDSATLTPGAFQLSFYLTNLGPDKILQGDSLLYTFTGAGYTFYRLFDNAKAVNDTVLISRTFSVTGPSTFVPFCVLSQLRKAGTITDDTANNLVCHNIKFGTTGIDEILVHDQFEMEELHVFPNPANSIIYLDYKVKTNAALSVVIVDITGKKIMEHDFGKANAGKKNLSLDVSSIGPGIYFIELTENNTKARGKLLIQK